jgi:predicted molibdopterin-dependent oxidoreductase YjgC
MISFTICPAENTKGMDLVSAAANMVILLGDSPEALQIPAEYANTYGAYTVGVRPDAGPSAGKGVFDMLYTAGAVRALFVMGADPVSTFPSNLKIMETLKSLELLIVQDIALTETAKLAHVVLPATSWAEKEGTFVNAEGVAQKLRKIVDAPGQSLPDWQILRNLSLAMGSETGIRNMEQITEEIAGINRRDP